MVVSGAFNASGSYAYLNGSGSFTTQGSSSINLAGVTGGYLGVSRPWVNEGTFSIGGDDYLYLGYNNGATLTNAASGSIHLDTSSTQGIYNGTGTNTVNNAGSLQQGSSGTRTIATVFNNTGTVQVSAGTLTVAASGTDTGSYAVDSGATLAFSSGTRTLNDGIGFSGAGSLLISGGHTELQQQQRDHAAQAEDDQRHPRRQRRCGDRRQLRCERQLCLPDRQRHADHPGHQHRQPGWRQRRLPGGEPKLGQQRNADRRRG